MKAFLIPSPSRLAAFALLIVANHGLILPLLADSYHPPGNASAAAPGPSTDVLKPEYQGFYPDIEELRKKADSSEAMDEALGGKTLHGTPVTPRTAECFPAEARDVMWQMDMVPDTDGRLRPLNFDTNNDGKIDPKERDGIRGRNTWVWWAGGNEGFWNWLAQDGYGLNDYVGFLDSRQRNTRFQRSGAVNQPGYKANSDPSKKILGLYLDVVDEKAGGKHLLSPPPWDAGGQRVPYPGDQTHKDLVRLPGSPEKPVDQIIAEQSGLFRMGDVPLFKDTVAKLAQMGDGLDYTVYGFPSGVVGLRLFLNPDFFGDTKAAAEARGYWDRQVVKTNDRYYTDREVFADTRLVRPFRVGMSCGFCHVAPHPLSPPADRENPEWSNLSSNIGNQYWKPATAFGNLQQPNSFIYHFLASQQAGTVDTSAISTDHINNANTINAVYDIVPRLARAGLNPTELQSPANVLLPSIEDPGLPINKDGTNWRHTPRVLLDGSDSIGAFGALARVYLNIGTFYEQWGRCHNAVIGFTPQRPFSVDTCQRNSVYWQTNEKYRVPYLAAFFTLQHPGATPPAGLTTETPATASHSSTQPMKLAAATEPRAGKPSEAARTYLGLDTADKRTRGREVWLDNCAMCHSSKQPAGFALTFARKNKGEAWEAQPAPADDTYILPFDANDWGDFKNSPAYAKYKKRLREVVASSGKGLEGDPLEDKHPFWQENFLSTDIRVPVTLVGTNSGRAMATNAIHNSVWDNFSSDTYKELDSVGLVTYTSPFTGAEQTYKAPGGGRGYYRPASHISLWATAPFLHNNTLGVFREDPSVAGRLVQFSDSIRRMLWSSRRGDHKPVLSDDEWRWLKELPQTEQLFDAVTPETIVAREGDLRGTGSPSAVNDKGLVYRVNVPATYLEFAPSFAEPFVKGLFGPCLTWFLATGLWLLLVPVLLWLAWKHRPLYVGITLIVLAVLVAAGIAVSGIGGGGSNIGVILMAVSGLLELASWEWWIIAAVLALFGIIFIQARPDDLRTPRLLLGLLLLGIAYAVFRSIVVFAGIKSGVQQGGIAVALLVAAFLIWYRLRPTLGGFAHAFFLSLALVMAGLGYTANRFIAGKKLFTLPLVNVTVGPLPLQVGPIPKGTPVNLVMNLDRESPHFTKALVSLVLAMAEIKKAGVTGDAAYEILSNRAGQALLDASKCPDFTLDRGHLFGEHLDPDPKRNEQAKEELISFLKTL